MNEANPAQLASVVVWGSLAVAFVFGAVANRTHFCTMGAVSDIMVMDDWNRMRMWLMAHGQPAMHKHVQFARVFRVIFGHRIRADAQPC